MSSNNLQEDNKVSSINLQKDDQVTSINQPNEKVILIITYTKIPVLI